LIADTAGIADIHGRPGQVADISVILGSFRNDGLALGRRGVRVSLGGRSRLRRQSLFLL
jgi:hypothetical protein